MTSATDHIDQPRRLMCIGCKQVIPEAAPVHWTQVPHCCACTHPSKGRCPGGNREPAPMGARQLRDGIDDYPPVAGADGAQQHELKAAISKARRRTQ